MTKTELFITIFASGFFTCGTLIGVYVDRPLVYVISGILAAINWIAAMAFSDGGK